MQAVRKGKWKLRLPGLKTFYGYVNDKGSREIELYNLDSDIGEKKNLAKSQPKVVAELLKLTKTFKPPKELGNNSITPRKQKKRKPKKSLQQ